MTMSDKIVAAIIQHAVSDNDKQKNRDQLAFHVRDAAAQGAQLVVLPELHDTQYFCQVEDTDLFDLAEPLDGETYQFYEALASELDLVLVISGFEKRAPGLYHNTAQVIDGSRGRVGTFRKMHIPDDPGFYEKFYFTPGDSDSELKGFKPIQTKLGRLGVMVCWDQWYPEAARLMALAGADLLIYPTAIGWDPNDDADEQQRQQEAWITVQRAHAIANGITVIVANRTGYEASPVDENEGIEFWGSSFIAGPQGEFLETVSSEEVGAFCTVVDLKRSEDVRRIWPYLRDRRVDAYSNLTKRWLDQN